jgi:hypothetical protein
MISLVCFSSFPSSGWPVVRVQRFAFSVSYDTSLLASDGRHGSATTVIETTTPLFRTVGFLRLLRVHTVLLTVKATL